MLITHCPQGNEVWLFEQTTEEATWYGPARIIPPLEPSRGGGEAKSSASPRSPPLAAAAAAPPHPTARELRARPVQALPGGASAGLGMRYVLFRVPRGAAAPICAFYRYFFPGATAELSFGAFNATDAEDKGQVLPPRCTVAVGYHQSLRFQEDTRVSPRDAKDRKRAGVGLSDPTQLRHSSAPYDGHHIAIYVNNFEEIYKRLRAYSEGENDLGLIYNNPRFPQFQYDSLDDALRYNEFRFISIVDLEDDGRGGPSENGSAHSAGSRGRVLYELEHEVRSTLHPGFSCRSWVVGG